MSAHSGWMKRQRIAMARWQGRPGAPTAGTGLTYWEAKAAGAFDVPATTVEPVTSVIPMPTASAAAAQTMNAMVAALMRMARGGAT